MSVGAMQDVPQVPDSSGYAPMDSLVIVIGDQLLVFRSDPIQCVAAAQGRRRCRNETEYDESTYSEGIVVSGADAMVGARRTDHPDWYLRQRCAEHLQSPAPDAVVPEWEIFALPRDSDLLVRPYDLWTPAGVEHAGGGDVPPSPTLDQMITDIPEIVAAGLPVAMNATALYRWYDAEDLLLYIGISDDLAGRTANHIKVSSWMSHAARATIERFPSRPEAARAETAAIKAEQPLFNDQHNRTPEAQLRLVTYLVRHGRVDLLAPAVSRG